MVKAQLRRVKPLPIKCNEGSSISPVFSSISPLKHISDCDIVDIWIMSIGIACQAGTSFCDIASSLYNVNLNVLSMSFAIQSICLIDAVQSCS